jgi:hypothetical protein
MRELRFDGLSPDGSRLVLAGKDGQKYTVVIDERLEAAVRRDRARIGQVEIEQAGVLRPREIQARIRAGATAEDVAAASGLPLEHIRRFEGPVLTERAWVAEQAQSTEVRRPGGDIELGDLVAERLAGERVDPADIAWDAWRRDDGLWVVIATFPVGQGTLVATWTYDSGSRTMTVADDNARALSAIATDEPLHLVAARPALASVAPLADDEDDEPAAIIRPIGHPSVRAAQEHAHADEGPEDYVDEPDAGFAADVDDELDAEELADELADAADGPQGLPDPEQALEELDEPDEDAMDVPVDDDLGDVADEDEPTGTDDELEDDDAADGSIPGPTADAEDVPLFDAPEPAAPQRPGGRPSVPSFDDILFGPGPQH